MDSIPHKDFWKDSPLVAKDGAHFLFEKMFISLLFKYI